MREERLEDALQYIDELFERLKNYTTTNDTPEGRTKHELRWFKEEILSGRLMTLPAPREQSSTLRDVYCEGYLSNIDTPRQKRLKKLVSLLSNGHYLMKPQFYSLTIEEIDKMLSHLADVVPSIDALSATEADLLRRSASKGGLNSSEKQTVVQHLVRDLHILKRQFLDKTVEEPPVDRDQYLGFRIADQVSIFGSSGNKEERLLERLVLLIFEGLRPDPDGKIRNRRW